ncbi:LacI family DNA-binding transcriptional regulator [Micromonospora sp. NBC_01796]|uniref:LacI family DNA-binding transcriptional regulator n=2 Tax=unclassified Micromonospora TaxID=2617518 RepID=UPI002DDBEA80|nr:LacI family DNA-binding transcriptional regulator [Micromonospora sp. NBC_01796]WSA86338.1 LacI family transcriptional regulator [Micromonospora sp. NBC_01796]
MTTLADVARLAGVSPATVSRIVSRSSRRVAPELRDRVLAAVEELQYVPNAHAQLLARNHRSAVGVIVHDVSDPYFAEITRGLQRVATEHGRLVIICNTYRDPDKELEYVELLRAHQAAAIILAGSGHHNETFTNTLDAKLRVYQATGGHIAVIGRHEHTGHAVIPANETGGYLIGTELYALGHTHLGVIAGPKHLTTTTDRLTGLRHAARDHGHKLPTRNIAYADFDRTGGATATAHLLDTQPHLTAIAALNDTMAIGALALLRTRGIKVPHDISITGFDDMPIARDVTPTLTTVRLPLADMGARAMTLALQPPEPNHAEQVPAELIRRESTAPPPEAALFGIRKGKPY